MSSPYNYQLPIINKYKQPTPNNHINNPTIPSNKNQNISHTKLDNIQALQQKTKTILLSHGFNTINEVLIEANTSISNLSNELECSLNDTINIINELKLCVSLNSDTNVITTPTKSSTKTAATLLFQNNKSSTRSLITCCKSIDVLLLGGIPTNEITEVVGQPGVGKTNVCIQVCVDARIPTVFGGVSGEAIYIDTEGDFSSERCYDMACALVQYVKKKRKRQDGDWYSVEDIMRGIHVFRVYDEAELVNVIHNLKTFLKEREELGLPVKVIVIDSIAFHYRYAVEYNDIGNRTSSLVNLSNKLHTIAIESNLAVLVTNQMTTNVNNANNDNQYIPALGESWAHTTSTRIILSKDDKEMRMCSLVKSLHTSPGIAYFRIVKDGIRDVSK